MKPIKCKLFSNIKKPSESESTHQGEHKCVVPELLALHLTNDLYKNAGKGDHLIGVEVSPMWPRLVELPPRIVRSHFNMAAVSELTPQL